MGDLQLVTSTQISKASVTLSRGSQAMETPTFTLPPRNIRVKLGGTARLDGKVKGHPEPQVIWHRNGKPVIAGDRHAMEQNSRGTFSLTIQTVQMEDAGLYKCEALSDAGCRQITVELMVEGVSPNKYDLLSCNRTTGGRFTVPAMENKPSIWGESPPKFVTKPSRVFAKVGQSCKLSAKITGRPQPQVLWLKGDMKLQPGGRFSVFEKSGIHFLEIRDVSTDDAGEYTCLVVNNAGKAMATAELTVQGSSVQTGIPAAPVAPVAKTTDSPAVKHRINGLAAEQKAVTGQWDKEMQTSTSTVKENRPAAHPQTEAWRQPAQEVGAQHSARTAPQIRGVMREPQAMEKWTPNGAREIVSPGRSERESGFKILGSPPHFEMKPQNQDVFEGTKVVFKCQVSGSPAPVLSWTRDGATLRREEGLMIQQEGSIHLLSLDRVGKKDGGIYECTATNSRGKASTSWRLGVKSPRVEVKAPVFSGASRDCAVTDRDECVLPRSAEGKPLAQVARLPGDKSASHARSSCDDHATQPAGRGVRPKDKGLDTSTAENNSGQASCVSQGGVTGKRSSRRTVTTSTGEVKKPEPPMFLQGLKDLQVMDGSQVTMTVEVTGSPLPKAMWLHDGQEIQESEDFHFECQGNRYRLLIQEVFPEDTGRYTCHVWNEAGEARCEATLTVQEPQDGVQPWFITKPKPTTVCLGQHALLSCAIAGDPFPEFLWMKDGQVVSSGLDFEILQKEDVVSLLIRRVKANHMGDYRINLKNKVGECNCVATLKVSQGTTGPALEPQQGTGSSAGGVDSAVCGRGSTSEVQESEEAAGVWGLLKRRTETRERCEDQVRQREAEQLDFRAVLGRRGGTRSPPGEEPAEETAGEQMDLRANLRRPVKPGALGEETRRVGGPQQVDFRAVLGKKGGVRAGPAASPEPAKDAATDFRSFLGNKKKQPNTESPADSPSPKAKASQVNEKQNDINCVDSRIIDKRSKEPGVAPAFIQKLKDVTALDGERLQLQCQVTADPPAVITWTLDRKVIKPSKFIVLSNEGGQCSLTIDKALPEDEGQYKCRAENSVGWAECDCTVLVDDPSVSGSTPADKRTKKISAPTTENEARIKKKLTPKTPPKQAIPPQILQFPEDMKILAGEKVNLLCKFSGAQPITCTWLKFRKPIQAGQGDLSIETTESTSQLTISPTRQEHCGCYTIELQNKFGTRQAALNLTIVDKPDPPARVPAATDIRRSSLTLSWYGPTYDGGSAVQSYHLEIWDSVDQEWRHLVSCNSTSYGVQDLLPDREYKFRVRAVNIYGIGDPSAESEPVKVGEEEEENKEEDEGDMSDEDAVKEPDYRDVVIKADQKVKDFYDVEERLGTGKFGQVFKLVEKSTKKVWAGKFIKAYSAKEKDNVRQEIDIMNSLHHPKLVQCVDAFEGKSDIVMVLEMISGGELFDRIIDEDFELTEREVIKYMLQIIDGVQFIHKQGIVHLDLKPENIMCVNKTGSRIKLIDFGLARRIENAGSLKVLFGTPEFVAPEVINYEPISYPTDMWSIGVICYILVSGLSPFMGDNDNETLSNVTSATWDFEDEAFDEISDEAKNFISSLLKKDMKARLTCTECLEHPWLKQDTKNMEAKKLSKERMKKYILRRKWQKTGHAVRAIGRLSSMAMLAGVSAKKGNSSIEDVSRNLLETPEDEEQPHVKPSFSVVIEDVEVVEGSAARFDCKIEGYPDPEVVWYKDDQPIKETRHFQIDYDEDGNCSLVIADVSADDDAKYTCKAMNSEGEATCTAELIVEVMAEEEEEEEEEEE
ncbi:myosin light chain kinase, smooth muscle isoform X1 [Scleropages formosus]|nr:myosin light chain kinase, smooth muscle-like isoform X1 [Scleropages formosus]